MSKKPYVVAARANLAPKKPYFALKTGEIFTQNVRLKTLIFIVENYRKKLLFNFSDKKHASVTNLDATNFLLYRIQFPNDRRMSENLHA